MKRALEIELFLLMLAGIALMGFLGWRVNKTLAGVDAATAQLQLLIAGANQTLDAVNRPCEGGNPCGTLATLDKTITKVGDVVVTTQLEERATFPHVVRAMDRFKDTAQALSGTAGALTNTANAATGTLRTAQTAITDFQRLLERLTEDAAQLEPIEEHLDVMIEQVDPVIVNTRSMTASGARILKDGADEADKLAHPPKKKLTFWGGVWIGLTYVHKLTPPIF